MQGSIFVPLFGDYTEKQCYKIDIKEFFEGQISKKEQEQKQGSLNFQKNCKIQIYYNQMCFLNYQGKIYKFNVLSDAMEFMLGIDRIKLQSLEINNQRLIGRKQQHKNEEGEAADLRQLEFDCQIITAGKTRKGLYIQPGINVCGVCTNQDCELKFQIVYCHLENQEAWNIPRMIEYSACPICKSNIGNQIKNIAYYNCEWKVIGKIKGEKSSFKLTQKTNPNECKQYLQKEKEPIIQFEYLSIQARPF